MGGGRPIRRVRVPSCGGADHYLDHRDGLARELGVTHYQCAHDTAAEDHPPQRGAHGHARGQGRQHGGRWQQRVGDVMTTPVVTVNLRTPYKRIAALLAQHQISAVPVGDQATARRHHRPHRQQGRHQIAPERAVLTR
jgi:hypothetical protein